VDDISRIEAVSDQGVGVDRFLTSFRMCRRRHLPGFP
jgi:hypothetical protein